MQLTDYHAKYFAHELTKRCPSDSTEKLAGALVGLLCLHLFTVESLDQGENYRIFSGVTDQGVPLQEEVIRRFFTLSVRVGNPLLGSPEDSILESEVNAHRAANVVN